jgi:hypothetical protein
MLSARGDRVSLWSNDATVRRDPMYPDIQFDIAKFIAEQGFSGSVSLAVPHGLAKRLAQGSKVVNRDIPASEDASPEDVMYVGGTEWNGLEVHYELGSLPGNQVIVSQDGVEFPLVLPARLRFL